MSSSAADSAGPSPRSSTSPRQDVSAKLFLGGLSWDTSEEKLREHFEGYGELVEVVVMRDRMTGRPRGFGFVTFRNSESADTAVVDLHIVDGRQIDVKKSVPQEGKPKACKVFVGGLSPETTEGDLKSYFTKFGDIAEVQIMQDHMSGRSRGFGFITFEEDSSAEKVFEVGTMHEIAGKKVEVKAATPKGSGSLTARQQQQQPQLLPVPPLIPQQHSPMRGRSSVEYDPAMMRAFASGMPGPAGYPAYPIMYGYGGRPTQMMAPGGQGSYDTPAAASLSQFPGMQHGHYMMMPPPSGMGPAYTPAGYSYQQQQSYTTAGGGGGMPYTPPSSQDRMQQQHHFSSPGMYPLPGSPSSPYRTSISSGGGGEPRSKSSASRTKVDSASSLDAHAQVERQFKRMGLDR
ncbi:hypothetical protein Ndes2526B_g06069 [Nannochloris sp. 'desiccata']